MLTAELVHQAGQTVARNPVDDHQVDRGLRGTDQIAVRITRFPRENQQIGTLARLDAEKLLGTKIFLKLYVKVKKDWREDEGMLKHFGILTDGK